MQQNDPAAIAEAALNMELPECRQCEHADPYFCYRCGDTGKSGGPRAVTGLAGFKAEMRKALGKFKGTSKRPADVGSRKESAAAIARIAGYIRDMCGEGE